ncbi:helix-turn-helix family protein [Acinetobacter baumannii 541915]|uniref:DNA adenine methylase n=1 Tax=Acinetobacter baumannii TaxID=470 RepID=UPI0004499603|nr:DNA adenine methylase [Acinetobacter baumannii]EXR79607.1 helix-turn-helix family protein [Acinetobacter baumannii 541915]
MDIFDYRTKNNLTQQELAQILGVSNITISKWENGIVKPSQKFLQKLNSSENKKVLAARPFRPIQYLGSKLKLLNNIEVLTQKVAINENFCDLFSGSGVVSHYMSHQYNIISCDIQNYSSILCSALIKKSKVNLETINTIINIIKEQYLNLPNSIKSLINYENNLLKESTEKNISLLINFSKNASLYINKVNSTQLSHNDKYLEKIINDVINLNGYEAYQIFNLYGGVYFSYEQSILLDLIRQYIENSNYDVHSKRMLIACLLSSASDIVNTVGKQFAQPMKLTDKLGNIKKLQLTRTVQNKRLNVLEKFLDAFINFNDAQKNTSSNEHKIFCSDVFQFLDEYKGEIGCFYADPPYTIDHYSRFYHVLETIALYDNPSFSWMKKKGKLEIMNGLYRTDRYQSEFSVPSLAPHAFEKLFDKCSKFNTPLILSYSPFNEQNNDRPRLLSQHEIEKLALKYYSKVTIVEVSDHKHRKLHSTNKNIEEIQSGEIFIVCEMI